MASRNRGGPKSVAPIVLQVLSALCTLAGVCLVSVAVLTTSWHRIAFEQGSVVEIHQHGLWLDFTYANLHNAGAGDQRGWISKIKFGSAVKGDEIHRAEAYQVNTLIMLCVGVLLSVVSVLLCCCAHCSLPVAIGWPALCIVSTFLSAVALVSFYLASIEPERRFISIPERINVEIGNSFWLAVYGTAMYAVAALLAVPFSVLVFLSNRTRAGERRKESGRTPPQNTPV